MVNYSSVRIFSSNQIKVFACLVGLSNLFLPPGYSARRVTSAAGATGILAAPADKVVGQANKFGCLPSDVQPDEIVVHGFNGRGQIKVEQKLAEMRARCRNGKLVDPKRREIRFFRPSCWGNPPPDYLEIQRRESEQLAKLKRRYTVIVFACNPVIQ